MLSDKSENSLLLHPVKPLQIEELKDYLRNFRDHDSNGFQVT